MNPLALRAIVAIALGLAVGMSLTCSPRVSIGDNSGNSDLNITFIGKAKDNPLFGLDYKGTYQATLDLKEETGWTVSADDQSPSVAKADAQIASLRSVISRGTRAIIMSCADNGLSPTVDDAIAKHIPVITFDSDCPDSGRLDFYGANNELAGAQAADLLASAMNDGTGDKKVAILTGSEIAENLRARVDGFSTRLGSTYPWISIAKISYCDESLEDCKKKVEQDILGQYPKLDGLFVVGLWGVQSACDCQWPAYCNCDEDQVKTRMPNWYGATKLGTLKTVAFDAHPFELELMRQGYLSALIGQRYYEWGYCTLVPMFKHLTQGETVKFPYSLGYYVVYPKDVDTVMSRWNELYDTTPKGQPPDCVDGGL